MKKKNKFLSGIQELLTREQWSSLFVYESNKREESDQKLTISDQKLRKTDKKLRKHRKGLKKGPKIRGNNIRTQANLNVEIILKEARKIKQANPNNNRQKLAGDLEIFSQDLKKSRLSKKYSYSYIYRTILKDFS